VYRAPLLRDKRRTDAIGTSGLKQLLRLLFDTQTQSGHDLLLECWAWPTVQHSDVWVVVLTCVATMLDQSKTPTPRVAADAVIAFLKGVAADPTVEAIVKSALLCVDIAREGVAKSYTRTSLASVYSSYQIPFGVNRLVNNLCTFSQVQLPTAERSKEYAEVLLTLASESAMRAQGAEGAIADTGAGKSEGELTPAQKDCRAHVQFCDGQKDLRALALCSIGRFVGLEDVPSALDMTIQTTLVESVTSYDAFHTSCAVNQKGRSAFLQKALPAELVRIATHWALDQFDATVGMKQHHRKAPLAPVGGPLAAVADLLLTKGVDTTQEDHIRGASMRRAQAIHSALAPARPNFLRYPTLWEPEIGKQRNNETQEFDEGQATYTGEQLQRYLVNAVVMTRCKSHIERMKNELRILSQLSFLASA